MLKEIKDLVDKNSESYKALDPKLAVFYVRLCLCGSPTFIKDFKSCTKELYGYINSDIKWWNEG